VEIFFLSFVRPDVRQRYEKDPSLLYGETEALRERKPGHKPLILIDEIQKVPVMLDMVQDMIDKKIANFVLSESSARKLRRGPSVNLLPGRLVALRLDNLTLEEKSDRDLEDILLYGSLPGILSFSKQDRETDLESYVTTYLEEEIRAEAIVRNIGAFARFLEYAASESGKLINFRKLSQEIGVAHTTIASYYEILDDCFIVDRVEPFTSTTTRRKLTQSAKFLFFDLGVRRLCAREGLHPPKETWGLLFEQMVGLELLHTARFSEKKTQIKFWRDSAGPEIDWIIDHSDGLIPVEVKWTDTPSPRDIKYLKLFLKEYPKSQRGYLVCRTPRAVKLDDQISAIPWREVNTLIP